MNSRPKENCYLSTQALMILWIELSLECTPHQNADPHCKNYIRELWDEVDVM